MQRRAEIQTYDDIFTGLEFIS